LEGKDLDNCERFEIGMNPNAAKHAFLLRRIRFEGTPRKPLLPPGITTEAPSAVFFEQSAPVFTCTRTLPKLHYTVVDWLGAPLMEGDWPNEGDAPLTLPALPPG
jgi:hypothetical protein